MTEFPSGDETGVVSPDRVRQTVMAIIRGSKASGWTLEGIAAASGIKLTTIKGWLDGKEPTLSKALSVAVVLGPGAVNAVLAMIGYTGARPLDEPDVPDLAQITARLINGVSVIATAAADHRIDHVEEPGCRAAADLIIAEVLPLSSAGRAS